MYQDPRALAPANPPHVARLENEQRRFKRVVVNLLGRFMCEDRLEYPCSTIDISVGGVALATEWEARIGHRIVAYFDEIGRLEGNVVRRLENGFAMDIQATIKKREKLAAQLTWLVNRDLLEGQSERRHERMVPRRPDSQVHLPSGHLVPCKVVDISVSGASILVNLDLQIGMDIYLGKIHARVVRRHEEGYGIEFSQLQSPQMLIELFG